MKSGPLPTCHSQQVANENVCHKRPRCLSLPRQSIDTSTAFIGLDSIHIEESQLCAFTTNSSPERELNQKTASDRSISDLGDEDQTKSSDPTTDPERERSYSRKRAREAASKRDCSVEEDLTYSINVPSQKRTKAPSKISTYGYFTVKEVQSELVYCITFAQRSLPSAHEGGQRQSVSTDLGES